MRFLLTLLFILSAVLVSNIIAYVLSEDYRFFIKKIKYPSEIVEQNIIIDDSIIDTEVSKNKNTNEDPQDINTFQEIIKDDIKKETLPVTALKFLESLQNDITVSDNWDPSKSLDIENTPEEEEVLWLLERYNLSLLENPSELLFGITPEYPDNFREWYSSDISFYTFPSKTYRELYDIFEVLSFDIPISINIVNNFWEKSFFINLKENYQDDRVRLVFLYKNQAFWLKIKKSIYNTLKADLGILRK